jgi:hypothetical protein
MANKRLKVVSEKMQEKVKIMKHDVANGQD